MSINEMIATYLEETESEKRAKKAAAALKESIIAYMAGNDSILTDEFVVIRKESKSIRLDTKKLYADLSEKAVKELYGKETVSVSLDIAARANSEQKSA